MIPPQKQPEQVVHGTVMVPAQVLAAIQENRRHSLLARTVGALFSESVAATTSGGTVGGDVGASSGFVPISGVQVELVRMVFDPSTGWYSEYPLTCEGGCPVTAADGSFTLSTLEFPSSDLAVKVSFTDPVDGVTPVVMRSVVYGPDVDISPATEATTQIIVNSLSSQVPFSNYTVNEVGALIDMIADEGVDISGLNFTDAINKIKNEVNDVLARFIIGFQSPGEMNVARPNDIFHLMEVGSQLISPNLNFADGAVNMKGSVGGAVSFDNDAQFQGSSAAYYWKLRSQFSGDAVRVFDQTLDELAQDPGTTQYNDYMTYGVPLGMDAIVSGNNGMSVAFSKSEATTYGLVSNDGGLMAFLRESYDAGQQVYERGLRILMKKWTLVADSYNTLFTDSYINSSIDPTDGTNDQTKNNNLGSSTDLNFVMDQNNYNVILFQNYLDAAGIELGTATGLWSFDSSTPVYVSGGSNPSSKPLGVVNVSGMDTDTVKFDYASGAVSFNQTKLMEPCPNLYQIQDGGSLMLRRDSSNPSCSGVNAEIFAGIGGVSADSEIFVAPEVYDDLEDNTQLELPLTGGAGRRGWYIGVKQAAGLADINVTGTYHVVGEMSSLDGSNYSLVQKTVHGSLQFSPSIVVDSGTGTKQVAGTLHSKQVGMDQILVDAVAPAVSVSRSARLDVSGSYKVSADGTFTFTLPGITETVTGIAGQVMTMSDSSQVAMFLAIPVVNSDTVNGAGERGVLLLAHDFLVSYPVPPDPPAPPP